MQFTRSRVYITILLILADIGCILGSLYLAYYLRFFSFFSEIFQITKGIPDWYYYRNILFFIIPLWISIFLQHNLYRVYFVPTFDELIRLTKAVSVGMLFLLLTTFFYREFSFSRLVFLLYWIISLFSLFVYRELFKFTIKYYLRLFIKRENILVVGKDNKMLKALLKKHHLFQVTFFPYDDKLDISKIKKVIQNKTIKQIILTHQKWPQDKLLELYDFCERIKVDLKFVPDIVQLCRGEIIIDSSIGIPIFHLKPVSLSGFDFYIKRVFDLIISIVILAFCWPVILFITILIKIDSRGGPLYSHKRMGYRGNIFNFYKFRTMIPDADALLEKFKEKSERKGPVFKMKKDPRVTKIGKFLRRYSLDEIPQIINVLRGEMSLIGPRPQVLWEAAAYDDWSKRRLRVLPGITGLWQVSGRARLSYNEMIELDIYYIENWSLGLDLRILLKTIPAIFSKHGAY